MATLIRNARQPSVVPENALARTAIEAIAQIEAEAKQKKTVQLEALQSARAALQKRMDELNHQVTQIDTAIASITGSSVPKGKRVRKNWDEARERIEQLLAGRKGHRFAAGDLIREFPDLDGMVMSILLKPLIEDGKVGVDISEGVRRSKYFVADTR